MKVLLLVIALILSVNAAFAESALSRFDALLKTNSIPIDGVSGSGATCRIDFKETATQAQRDEGIALRGSFDWLDKADPTPAKFVIDCNGDGAIPVSLRQNVNLVALWFKLDQKGIALDIWTLIKASATAAQITAIRTHATNNGITLP